MKYDKPTLVFVYNADGGIFNLLTDVAHKILSPQTYSCNLCSLTHSSFGMKDEWREYLKTLPAPFEFLHADELKAKYKIENVKLPAIFKKENGKLKETIGANAINGCRSIADLKQIINAEISKLSA
ncbi:MAG: hypothetical protein LC778_18145 [Acidobacteria bacterium]|nr:hypothetical protein [Acidobacteriota bacterium]